MDFSPRPSPVLPSLPCFRVLPVCSSVQAVRSGAPLGAAVFRPKTVQIWLAHGNPGLSANEEGKVDGFDISFNIKPPEDRPQTTKCVPHANNGAAEGVCVGPDAMHDCNHGVEGRRKLGGLGSGSQLNGASLNAHEQNHAKKKKYFSMLKPLGADRFTFMVTLVNELENEAVNRRSLNAMVRAVSDHPHMNLMCCQAEMYWLGRCWCNKSLLRSYDQFGRVRLTFLG